MNKFQHLAAKRRSDEGFTLIELLIVIVIMGILAGIVVFSVRGIQDKGDVAACKTSVSTVDTAFEALVANATGATPTSAGTSLGDLAPKYLHAVPTKIGSTDVDDTTTVDAVDAINCG
jgi:general secretion pathway protein G